MAALNGWRDGHPTAGLPGGRYMAKKCTRVSVRTHSRGADGLLDSGVGGSLGAVAMNARARPVGVRLSLIDLLART